MRSVVAWALAAGLSTLANAAAQPSAPSGMTVAQILEKNAEARGGAEAWRKIETMRSTSAIVEDLTRLNHHED